jgi:cyclophilin family peptidyl-prolyl cis-trans isomerase
MNCARLVAWAGVVLLARSVGAEEPSPRVVFHTVAGDLVFALDAKAAPRTVEQFLTLVRAGVYDTTAIVRIAPGFIAQVSTAQDRPRPLTPAQAALLKPIPLEAGELRHVRGALSLAHPDANPNGGESSFCIMLGPAPHLDGKYTVFGRLEAGDDVLAELLKAPRVDRTPTVRLSINRAEVLNVGGTAPIYLAAAHPVVPASASPAVDPTGSREGVLGAGLALMVLLAAGGALLRAQLSPPVVNAVLLTVVLVGAFLMLALLLPEGQHRPWLGALLFFGMVGVFKALGRFESAVER